jgi:hypothetical protein
MERIDIALRDVFASEHGRQLAHAGHINACANFCTSLKAPRYVDRRRPTGRAASAGRPIPNRPTAQSSRVWSSGSAAHTPIEPHRY